MRLDFTSADAMVLHSSRLSHGPAYALYRKGLAPRFEAFACSFLVDARSFVSISPQILVNKALNQTYVLYQCGTPRPTPDLGPYRALANGYIQFMEVPRRSLAVDETVPLTMLEVKAVHLLGC